MRTTMRTTGMTTTTTTTRLSKVPHSPLVGESSYTGGTESVEGTETDMSAIVFEDADADDTEDPSEAEVRSRYAVPGRRVGGPRPQESATASDSDEGAGSGGGAEVGRGPARQRSSGHAPLRLCRREYTRLVATCERLWRRLDRHERLAAEVEPSLLAVSEELVAYARASVRAVRTGGLQPRARPSFAVASQRAHSLVLRTCACHLVSIVAAARRVANAAPTGVAARLKRVRTDLAGLAVA